jgi:uncharacterized protein YndB with AHSA1/START domain
MTTVMNETANRELSISRILNAPQELVWAVWTKPEHITHWWGPAGFSTTTHEMNLKPGGVWSFVMHGPDGRDYSNKIVFIEVKKPELLVYKHTGEDDTEDIKFHVTVNFEKKGSKTKLTMRSLFDSPEELERVIREFGAKEGMYQHVDRLEEYLEKKQPAQYIDGAIVIERTYNAPVEKVWKAITDKDEMKKWYFDIAEFKATPGFEFEFVGKGKQGEEFLHLCKIDEVIKNKKLSYSWRYKGYEGSSHLSFELFDEGNKTRVKLTHKGLESFPVTTHHDFAKENFMEGWTHIIGTGLKEYVEKPGS